MRFDARTETFEDVTVLGIPMIFTCLRIDRKTVPDGLFMYEVRHDDDQQGMPVEIAKWVAVNHWGTLISKEEIVLESSPVVDNAYRMLDENDWNYEGTMSTLDEYINV